MRLLKLYLCLFSLNFCFSQNIKIPEITPEIKENANSIVLNAEELIEIKDKDRIVNTNKKLVFIVNQAGMENIDLVENYSKSKKIKSLKVIIYNEFGKLIKEFKKSDFTDQSVADGISIFTDDRVLFLDYKPTTYPLIISFESESETKNTAFISGCALINNLNESVIKSTFKLINETDIKLNKLEKNVENYNIKKTENNNSIFYEAININAIKPEIMAEYEDALPITYFSLNKINLEGYTLDMENWNQFGKNYFEYFLKDNSQISELTINKLNNIIKPEDSKLTKIKKTYQFIQDNTRYISVQIGVGGWKPMKVTDVEKYGYGDCKALSNYARAILNYYNIESFYTIIYGGNNKNIDQNRVAIQGNHAILTVPNENKNLFLECTSQTNPFAYQGDFTSNRKALIIKPNGAEIVNTNEYKANENIQNIKATFNLSENGTLSGTANISGKFIQYENFSSLEFKDKKDQVKFYQNYFSHLNNLKIENIKFENLKDKFEFNQNFNLSTENYLDKLANDYLLTINVLNRFSTVPQKYRNRKFDFEIENGFEDYDQISITIPNGFKVSQVPENFTLTDVFGYYSTEVKVDKNQIIYKRVYKVNSGKFTKNQYEAYRKFKEQISKQDNLKLILQKI